MEFSEKTIKHLEFIFNLLMFIIAFIWPLIYLIVCMIFKTLSK